MAFKTRFSRDAKAFCVFEAGLRLTGSIALFPIDADMVSEPILRGAMTTLAADPVLKPNRRLGRGRGTLGYRRINMAAQADLVALGMDFAAGGKTAVIALDVARNVTKENGIGFLMRVFEDPNRILALFGIDLIFVALVVVAVMASRRRAGTHAHPVRIIAPTCSVGGIHDFGRVGACRMSGKRINKGCSDGN